MDSNSLSGALLRPSPHRVLPPTPSAGQPGLPVPAPPDLPVKKLPVCIPTNDENDDLIEANRLTIIGRLTNPMIQKPRAVIDFMAQIWNLEGRIEGKLWDSTSFTSNLKQKLTSFRFLKRDPSYHYKRWMLLMQRWEPTVSEHFPSNISFNVRVHGIPLHYWSEGTVKTIDKELGNYVVKDAKEAKIWVEVNGLQPLIMKMEIELPTEDVTEVEFEYIKIEKYCFTCFSLFHEESDCPQRPQNALPPKERKLGITQMIALQRIEAEKKRHDDRRGYIRPEVFRTSTRQSEDKATEPQIEATTLAERITEETSQSSPEKNCTNSDYYRNNAPSQQYCVLERNRPNSGSFAHQKLPVTPSANSDIRGTILPVAERNLPSNPRDEVTPTRSLKDHLGIPLNGNEGTTSGSKEQRSALAHLTYPIPNEEQPARRTPSFESGRLQKAVIRTEEVEMVNQEIIEESSPLAGRIPATLRLGAGSWRTIKRGVIPIAPQSKVANKRRVTKTPIKKRIARSPLLGILQRKPSTARASTTTRRKLVVEKDNNLPCWVQ
ncbi:LOW QUALITY PROTEIN: hypothetical protein HID58_093365 [Brassica napus]|uniref:DUF4283 domain-containing protein n=1 Tax=Brassica napus TaxID=3708 RepID=A0ABQ7XDF3_BRANA|nr:LOW QUALITY PROTEIN: hypothetical protein HID58_093365 [Brassica napus]